jgi:hypothetical protein
MKEMEEGLDLFVELVLVKEGLEQEEGLVEELLCYLVVHL